MKLAIIGCRHFDDYDFFKEEVVHFLNSFLTKTNEIEEIISGGAKGADSFAKQFGEENNIPVKEYLPDYSSFGKSAPLKRNITIIDNCDKVLAFWDHKSPGTKHALNYAKSINKPSYIKDGWVDGYILSQFLLNKGTDNQGRTLEFILNQSNEWLEETHDYIQFVYPNNIRSSFNNNAPIITAKQAAKLAKNKDFQSWMVKSLVRFKDFFGLELEQPHWITPRNHNFLRLTRILIACNLFHRYADAKKLYGYLTNFYKKYPTIIDSVAFDYWTRAAFTKYE